MKISNVTNADRQKAMQTILTGFAGDPFVRWFWPKDSNYVSCCPAFDAFGGAAIDLGSAYCTPDMQGVALWLPPGTTPDEERFIGFLQETADKNSLEEGFRVFESMDTYHPTEPYWYLPLIGVDPIHQGIGIGAALMNHALQRCDREQLPAYLESTNPKNIPLYERHGFEVMGKIKFGKCPVVTPMFRAAR